MPSGNKGQRIADENAYKAASDAAAAKSETAISTAAAPDELEARRRAHVLALDKWQNGESGPVDVRNMPGNDVNMALFNDALKVHDAKRVGGGFGTMGDSVNPNYIANLEKENEQTRHMMASGALEGEVDNALAAKDAEMTGLYQTADARNINIAGLRSNAYQNAAQRELNIKMRPRSPSFFKQLALTLAGQTGQMATAGAM